VSADVNNTTPAASATRDALAPIPTPMHLQWRRVRYQLLPAIIFTVSLGLTAYLWKNYAGSPHGIGEVSALTIRIAAPHDGRLAKLETYPKVYDHVDANQTVARFDIAHLVTQEEKAQEDLGRLQNDLGDATTEIEKLSKRKLALNSTMFNEFDEKSLAELNAALAKIAKNARLAARLLAIDAS